MCVLLAGTAKLTVYNKDRCDFRGMQRKFIPIVNEIVVYIHDIRGEYFYLSQEICPLKVRSVAKQEETDYKGSEG